ncbi:hypothetical protein Ciccas_003487 [Cichlidogyrus casuarinus]|uniref:IRG-type G domain-containing protein n=1 Tax=Cichlidogyrus casuarinus TaxID=1844966 RepID=A0ABD2QHJ1_9PLAT
MFGISSPGFPLSNKLDVAVFGQKRCGKSSFVNAIRGLSEKDPGAAKVGGFNTLTQPMCYPVDGSASVNFWDMPPFPDFSSDQEKFLPSIGVERFDLFVILTDDRLEDKHLDFATALFNMGKRFVFARTKTDEVARMHSNPQDAINSAKEGAFRCKFFLYCYLQLATHGAITWKPFF